MIHPKACFRLRPALAAAGAMALLGLGVPLAPIAAQEGAAAVQDITVTDVVLPLGGTLLKAPKLTASGTRLSKEDLAGSSGRTRPCPGKRGSPARCRSSRSGSDDGECRARENRQIVTYRDVVARDVRGGRVGELIAAGATISVVAGPNRSSGTYGQCGRRISISRRSIASTTLPGDGKGPVQRVYGTVQVSDVTYSDARDNREDRAPERARSRRSSGARRLERAFEIVAAGLQGANDRRAIAARPPT